jgi:two-component system chemotaxis response regulator CheY
LVRRRTATSWRSTRHFEVVGEAANGAEAIKKYKELKPDFVVMDAVMPLMGGIDATREILKVDQSAVVILCFSLDGQTKSLAMESIEAGATDFIVKPFHDEDVVRLLKKF